MSEEQKEGVDSTAPGSSEAKEEQVTRRVFMRKAAQVGGLTALGLVGAETILPAVLERMARISGNSRLAAKVAQYVVSEAHACDNQHECAGSYWAVCYSPGVTKNCDGATEAYYHCEQGDNEFGCKAFNCTGTTTAFSCPKYPGGFDCAVSGGGAFHCLSSLGFDCWNSFVCRYHVECALGQGYTCTKPATTYTPPC